jgi:hypothetical protein
LFSLKIWFKSRLPLFSRARPSPSFPWLAHAFAHGPRTPPSPPLLTLLQPALTSAGHAPCRPPGPPRRPPSAWRRPHQTPTSPPLFSLNTARPQKGADAPAIPFSHEHLTKDPNSPRLPMSSLSRFPVAGTLHLAPDFCPSRTANRLPGENSPRAMCASHR